MKTSDRYSSLDAALLDVQYIAKEARDRINHSDDLIAKLTAERDAVRGSLRVHEKHWDRAAEIVGLHKDAYPAEILAEMRMCVVAIQGETKLATGTGPVALPTVDESPKPTLSDLRGLQKIVTQHSRDIPDLRETVRSLSSTVAKLRSTMDASGKAR